MEILKVILEFFEVLIACGSLVFSVWIYTKQRKNELIKDLARQLVAFASEEQEAMKWIGELTNSDKLKSIQSNLRDRALQNKDNIGIRPHMSINSAKSFL